MPVSHIRSGRAYEGWQTAGHAVDHRPCGLHIGAINSDHIEGSGNLAYSYGTATWTSGRPPDATSVTHVRQILVWRREADGVWRIAMEAFLSLEAGK